MYRVLKATLLALAATTVLAGAANAANGLKNVSFSATPVGDLPTLVFQEKNGQYVLGKGGPKATIKFHVKAEKKNINRIVRLRILNVTGQTLPLTDMKGFSVKKLDKVVMHKVDSEELNHYITIGRKVCQDEGDLQKVVKKTVKPGFDYMTEVFVRKTTASHSGWTDWEAKTASVPVQFICKPEPLKVIDADLSVKFDGSPFSCPVKATLTAKFKTNKPGTFKFNLYRGDGAFQTVTRTAGKSKVVSFTKHYTFKKPTNRKYLVATIPSGASSGWVPMKVHCNGNAGGFQTAPKPNSNY